MVATFVGNKSTNIDSIVVKGYLRNAVGDTLVSIKVPALTDKVGLPLSLTADTTGFEIFVNGKTGTFWLKHTMDFQLISRDCGFAPNYQLIATRHSALIDSVRVSDPKVDPNAIERYATKGQNVTIYLHLTTP
jgi:hypothetical protein